MRKLAIIDIGSNSVRLVLLIISDKNSFRIIDDQKVSARLADGLAKNGYIKKERFDLGLKTVKVFKNLIDIHEIKDVLCIGTAALRRASNGAEFVKKVFDLYKIKIDVISGEMETFYDYCAVINSFDLEEGLLVDIGGGSIELGLFENRELIHSTSIDYGAIDITQKFNLDKAVNSKDKKDFIKFYREIFSDLPWLDKAKGLPVIGVGGSIRNIGKIDRKQIDYPLDLAHNYTILTQRVDKICKDLQSKSVKERKKVPGLSKKRADIIVGATSFINVLMKKLNSPYLAISGFGVREGLIYNYLLPKGKHLVDDVLVFSLMNSINNFGASLNHSKHIYFLASSIFDKLSEIHKIPNHYLNTLKAAAYLHDIGMFIQYYQHQDHTFYMMLNSSINGLTQRELVMSTFIAANHRDKKCHTCDDSLLSILSKNELQIKDTLTIILKLAEALDRNQVGLVENVDIKIREKSIIFSLETIENPAIEIESALNYKKLFKKHFNKNLIVKRA
ncbi:MAG: exopolyphosphatase [Clostridia bacterium]